MNSLFQSIFYFFFSYLKVFLILLQLACAFFFSGLPFPVAGNFPKSEAPKRNMSEHSLSGWPAARNNNSKRGPLTLLHMLLVASSATDNHSCAAPIKLRTLNQAHHTHTCRLTRRAKLLGIIFDGLHDNLSTPHGFGSRAICQPAKAI